MPNAKDTSINHSTPTDSEVRQSFDAERIAACIETGSARIPENLTDHELALLIPAVRNLRKRRLLDCVLRLIASDLAADAEESKEASHGNL